MGGFSGKGRFRGFHEIFPAEELQSLCKDGHLEKALDVLLRMDQRIYVPSENTYWLLLRACIKRKALTQAKQVHAHMVWYELGLTAFIGEYLVMTLVKCGGLQDALQVFHSLPNRTAFSWTAVISGYSSLGKGQEALKMYQCMCEKGLEPNGYTFVSLIKACGKLAEEEEAVVVDGRLTKVRSLEIGRALHADARRKGFDSYVSISNTLITMYGKCGSIVEAENVFNRLSQHDLVSWNVMISAYVDQHEGEKGLQLYIQMVVEGMDPNERTFVIALRACCMCAEKEAAVIVERHLIRGTILEIGQALHADAWRKGLDSDIFVGSTLVRMYGKCGTVIDAEKVFSGFCHRDVVLWTAMLSLYVERNKGDEALQLYRQMQDQGVCPNERTLVIALQACCVLAEKEAAVVVEGKLTKATSQEIGKQLHADALRKGFGSHVFVGSALVMMYGKCGSIVASESVFHGMSQHNVVLWNTMLSAYVEQREGGMALQMFKRMQEQGMSPNERTFVIALQACCSLAEKEEGIGAEGRSIKMVSLGIGHGLHADAQRKGFNSDVFIGSALVTMYGKCGSVEEAENVFSRLSKHNVVSWNALLSVYVEQGEGEKGLQLYKQMKEGRVNADHTTLVCVLQVCGEIGSVEICRHVNQTIVSMGYDSSVLLANTLIHAYGSCASVVDAEAVCNALPQPDTVSWSALIAGYAQEGNCGASVRAFEDLQLVGIKPDLVTFLSLISACSHAGLVDKGVEYFESISRDYALTPGIEHYFSMVDLLGRAGDFLRVEEVLLGMPMQPDLAMWLCLLGACRVHGNVDLGKHAFDHAVHLQPKQVIAYVLMSNIYADAGLWDLASKVDSLRQNKCTWNMPVQSWIKHEQDVFSGSTLFSGKRLQMPMTGNIYDLLEQCSNEGERVSLCTE